ncbi:MAG: hypothetical protein JO132_11055 [Streptosporangiaceae bacterium]|nr:hypothetical protein [Streptosporangiaceae bacterium]
MPRYLLVLDMDLLAADELLGLEPVSYLVARQEQQPCEVTVLSLVDTQQARLSRGELMLGSAIGMYAQAPAKYPIAPKPDHDVNAAAGNRMQSAVRQLKTIGCRASGIISDEDLVQAVRSETRAHEYDEVILATGRHGGTRLARVLGRDPVHQLQRRWGPRLIVFGHGSGTTSRGQDRQR